jgi:hypothetical protein
MQLEAFAACGGLPRGCAVRVRNLWVLEIWGGQRELLHAGVLAAMADGVSFWRKW